MTRAQSQAQTRALLLATAKRLFLTEGYPATSVDAVAQAAGYSRGAVYSAYGGKERLALAVLEEIYTDEISAVAKALAGPGDLPQRLAAFEDWARRMIGAEGWTTLSIDLATTARRDPELQTELAAQIRRVRAMVAAVLSYQATTFGLSPALSPDDLGTVIFSLLAGLGLQRLVDPEVSVGVAVRTMRILLDPATAATTAAAPATGTLPTEHPDQ